MGDFNSVPGGSGHDAASVLGLRLAAAFAVMAHAEVVAYLVRHGGGYADS